MFGALWFQHPSFHVQTTARHLEGHVPKAFLQSILKQSDEVGTSKDLSVFLLPPGSLENLEENRWKTRKPEKTSTRAFQQVLLGGFEIPKPKNHQKAPVGRSWWKILRKPLFRIQENHQKMKKQISLQPQIAKLQSTSCSWPASGSSNPSGYSGVHPPNMQKLSFQTRVFEWFLNVFEGLGMVFERFGDGFSNGF